MKPLTIHFYTCFVHEQGTYFRFHNLAQGLQTLGQQVTVYACDQNWHAKARTEIRDKVTYQITPVLPTARLSDAASDPISMIKNAMIQRPACDIAHLFQPFPTAALAWKHAQARAHFWDWDDLWTHNTHRRKLRPLRQHWPKSIVKRLEHSLPRKADHVTAIDRYLADLATERGAQKVTLLYNPSLALPVADKLETRKRLGLDSHALYVGFMGFTIAEMEWCFAAVAQSLAQFPTLRLAICGPDKATLGGLPAEIEGQVDTVGRLSQSDARAFSAALDLALLPLDDNLFNQSRFPVKFSEYLMAGTPVLCSEIGECALLIPSMPYVFGAGRTRTEWMTAFPQALEAILAHQMPVVNQEDVSKLFSEDNICSCLLNTYQDELKN